MAGKPIRFTGHARFEMKRRGIGSDEVIRVIRSPGQVVPSVKGRRVYQGLIGRLGRLLLRVVVAEDALNYHVITVYKTSRVTKYWRKP